MYLSMITSNSLIFVESAEEEKEERKEIKLKVNDRVEINGKSGIVTEYFLRLHDVEPYISVMLDNQAVTFAASENILIKYI